MGAQQKEEPKRTDSFLTEAGRLLKSGRPQAALRYIYQFSDDSSAQEMTDYWRFRALTLLMNCKPKDAYEALDKSGGLDQKFLDEFIEAIEVLAFQKPPRMWWNVEKRDVTVRLAVYEALELARKLELPAHETRQRLNVVLPSLSAE